MGASEKAVAAVMETLGCQAGTVICLSHREYLLKDRDRGCPVAVAAADLAVDTDRPRIQAQALREAAREASSIRSGYPTNPQIRSVTAIRHWLRARANRIEAQP